MITDVETPLCHRLLDVCERGWGAGPCRQRTTELELALAAALLIELAWAGRISPGPGPIRVLRPAAARGASPQDLVLSRIVGHRRGRAAREWLPVLGPGLLLPLRRLPLPTPADQARPPERVSAAATALAEALGLREAAPAALAERTDEAVRLMSTALREALRGARAAHAFPG
jgi:hypothetical protein